MSFLFDDETTVNIPGPTPAEQELTSLNVELARTQIDLLRQSQEQQKSAFEFLQDQFTALEEQQQAALDDPVAKELQDLQLEIARRGGKASPEQLEAINTATESALAEGQSDIEKFSQSQVEDIRNILAPSRGLRPTDSPIVDRASRVGEEATRQFGQLERNLRGAQAQAELNFPLAADQAVSSIAGFQQQLAESARNFQAELRQTALENQLRLQALRQEGSLGLLGIQPSGASALNTLAATRLGQTTTTTSPGLLTGLQAAGGFLRGVGAVRQSG